MLGSTKPAIQSSIGRQTQWGGARLVNCFAEQGTGDQRDAFMVQLIPGLVQFTSLGVTPRGLHRMGDTLFAVAGTSLYSVTSAGVATSLGTIPGTGRVRMASNGTQIGIVAGANGTTGYVWNGTTISTPANLPAAVSDVAYIDGYLLWTVASNDQFVISALNDATVYDPLDIATVEGSPDDLVGLIVDHREVQFYGKQSIEIWYNSGASDFPFERQGNAFIERGCMARDTTVKMDNSVYFLGDDRIVYRLDGYSPIRVSTHAIEYAIRNATDFFGCTYSHEGHKFYVLNTDDGTYAYDVSTGAWHERKSTGLDNWRVGFSESVFNTTIFAAHNGTKLYTASYDTYAEDGDTISMEIMLPIIESPDRRRLNCYAFEFLCEAGVGLTTGQGSDPQAMLTYSDDGGHTWSNELWRTMGAIGQYSTRAIWRKLGQFRQRQFKITITDPVRRAALGYFVDAR